MHAHTHIDINVVLLCYITAHTHTHTHLSAEQRQYLIGAPICCFRGMLAKSLLSHGCCSCRVFANETAESPLQNHFREVLAKMQENLVMITLQLRIP